MFGQIVEFNDFIQKLDKIERDRKELVAWYKRKVEMIVSRAK